MIDMASFHKKDATNTNNFIMGVLPVPKWKKAIQGRKEYVQQIFHQFQ